MRTFCLRLLPDSVAAAIWTQALLRLSSSMLTTWLPSHPREIPVIRPYFPQSAKWPLRPPPVQKWPGTDFANGHWSGDLRLTE